MDKIDQVLTKSVEEIIPSRDDLKKLMDSKKIRVYLGIDPTGTHLHLGHTIAMRKLQQFADLGHEAILLIGTGTVLVGDPSQRAQARQKITKEEIEENIKTWKEQAQKVIDFEKVQIKKNGDWLLKLDYADIVKISSNISAMQLFKRNMFQERLKREDTIWTHELLYPLMQGYDSVAMDVDLEIGGTDQTFNMLIGRELQRKMANREKFVLTIPLINGTDNKPMSKSSGNCIWLDDTAQDMYGKIMSMSDTQIPEYWSSLTELDPKALSDLKPLEAKKKLAFEIVKTYYGENGAQMAQNQFENVVQKGNLNWLTGSSLPTISLPQPIISGGTVSEVIFKSGEIGSISQTKRLTQQGAIDINNVTVINPNAPFKDFMKNDEAIVKIGKKKIIKIKTEK